MHFMRQKPAQDQLKINCDVVTGIEHSYVAALAKVKIRERNWFSAA